MGNSVSAIPAEGRPYQGQRAGLVTRMTAAVIDGIVVVLVMTAMYLGIAGALFLVNPRTFSFPDVRLVASLAVAFVVLVVYFTVAWSITGRTYGDHVMGLRVVGVFHERMRPVAAFVRAVFCAIFPIGLLWVAASPTNRSLQDTVLRTSVIYDWSQHSPWDSTPRPPDELPR